VKLKIKVIEISTLYSLEKFDLCVCACACVLALVVTNQTQIQLTLNY